MAGTVMSWTKRILLLTFVAVIVFWFINNPDQASRIVLMIVGVIEKAFNAVISFITDVFNGVAN